jgi:hypothetical protein
MFRMGHPADHPLRVRPELLQRRSRQPALSRCCASARRCAWTSPTAAGATSSSSAWTIPRAPACSTSPSTSACTAATRAAPAGRGLLRVIDEPVLRLVSVDLGATAEITAARRGLRFRPRLPGPAQGGVIAAGIVPPGIEGSGSKAGRSAGAHRRPRARPGNRQPRQRHPQGLAAGRLHQPAGRADRRPACGPPARPLADRPA